MYMKVVKFMYLLLNATIRCVVPQCLFIAYIMSIIGCDWGHRRSVLAATLLHNKLKVCILVNILHRSALYSQDPNQVVII